MDNIKRVHFVGLGGIGMSALARHFLHEKKEVSGSDRASSRITDALQTEGVHFFESQSKENITEGIDLVVYTEAMAQDHEELVAARKKKISCVNYFEALGMVANPYYLIAVAGTHGKTTTTAMLVDIFEEAGLDPSAVIGSLRARTGKNYRAGKSRYFIAEACEYKRDFLHLKPEILVVTNIEAEHLDYYKDLDDVVSAFREFALAVPESGFIVCNVKDPAVKKVVAGAQAKIIDYTQFLDLMTHMKQPGMHNRMNAAAALAVAAQVKIDAEVAKNSVGNFAGTWRRFEYKGKTQAGALVYDDYGHHPTEIAATLSGARELYPDKKITLVFQPHLYSRTKTLLADFADAIAKADSVILLPIFAAREEADPETSSEILARKIEKRHPGRSVQVAADFKVAEELIKGEEGGADIIISMGASDIYKLAEGIIES